jgi:hypothetical protein
MAAMRVRYPKYGLCLQAHSHHYERTDPAKTDGIQYIVGPGGGSTLGGLVSSQPSWSLYRMNHLEHMRIHVQEDRIDGYVICGPDGSGSTVSCDQGTIIDSWTVLAWDLVGVPLPALSAFRLRVSAEPNPAHGSVALRVESDAAGERVLEVFDLSGRLVRRLSSGWEEGGARSVRWDGTNASGRRVPAGVYVARLQSGGKSVQTRIAMLR